MNNIVKQKLFYIMVFLCIIPQKSYNITLSFDTLFPKTWYEKGVNVTLCLLQKMHELYEQKQCVEESFFDVTLGKSFFAYFCFEKMSRSKTPILAEDSAYLVSLIDTLENYIQHIECDYEYKDQIQCLESIIMLMKERCLHIPSNINTK